MVKLIHSDPTMANPHQRPFWLDHQAFCRRHGLDYEEDLVPQFTEAFEHYGRDYEQIRGSVSHLLFITSSFYSHLTIIFRMLPLSCFS